MNPTEQFANDLSAHSQHLITTVRPRLRIIPLPGDDYVFVLDRVSRRLMDSLGGDREKLMVFVDEVDIELPSVSGG